MEFDFNLKTHAIFGSERALDIPQHLMNLKHKDVAVIIDENVLKSDYAKKVANKISDEVEGEYLFINYEGNKEPTYQMLDETMTLHRSFFGHIDCFVGIGGGSVIDFAKGLAFLTTNSGPAIQYRGFPQNIHNPIPTIAVPTTAGSGSEVTYNAVFVDEKEHKKLGINTTLNFPELAILDPLFLKDCPPSVMISSGLDALTHAIEGFGATKSNYLTRMFSYKALCLILNNLPKAVKSKEIFYVSNMMLGAYLAGIGLMNSGSGPAGAMSYILGPKFNVPHGLAGAVFLPHIVNHNEKEKAIYFDYNDWRGECDELYPMLYDLYKELGVDYTSLKQFGIDESNVDILLKGVETLQPAFNQNPVPFSIEDAKRIIRGMI